MDEAHSYSAGVRRSDLGIQEMILHYCSNLLNQLALSLVVLPSYSSLREAVLPLQSFQGTLMASTRAAAEVAVAVPGRGGSPSLPSCAHPAPLPGQQLRVGSVQHCHYSSWQNGMEILSALLSPPRVSQQGVLSMFWPFTICWGR